MTVLGCDAVQHILSTPRPGGAMRHLALPGAAVGSCKPVPCTPRTPRITKASDSDEEDEEDDADYLVMDVLQHLPPEKAEQLMRAVRAKDRKLQALQLENWRLHQQLASQKASPHKAASLDTVSETDSDEELEDTKDFPNSALFSPVLGPAPPVELPQGLTKDEREILVRFAPIRWWPLGIAAVYADRSQNVLYAWSNTSQCWETMSWKGVKWFDTLELASEIKLRCRTGKPGLIQTLIDAAENVDDR